MKTIPIGKDVNGLPIKKGDEVIVEADGVSGEIKKIWNDGTVDVSYTVSHQGPVTDTFDIKGHRIIKMEQLELGEIE